MKALLLFHFRVGVRVAVRAFTPLFSAFLIIVFLQMYPIAFVTSIATDVFALQPPISIYMLLGGLCFLLPAWAAPLMLSGLNGWVRHLPISGTGNRRGLTLALVSVQVPLAALLTLLAIVAHACGRAVILPGLRLALLLAAGAFAAVPSRRQPITALFSAAAAICAVAGGSLGMAIAFVLLAAVDILAGPLRDPPPVRAWRPAGPLFSARIAMRALGPALAGRYIISLIPIGAAVLFTVNNSPPPGIAAGVARFGGALSLTLFISGLVDRLLVRRPVWPWARSLPWSAANRILSDATLLAALALPVTILAGALNPGAALRTTAVLPVLTLRGASFVRKARERKTGAGGLLLEGFFMSATVALIGWAWTIWLAATPVAFLAARKAEVSLKVTRWVERHHASAGDSLSWSGR
jgi:hypothetical protein